MADFHFYPIEALEVVNNEGTDAFYEATARNVLRLLTMGWRSNWKEVLSLAIFKAVFVNRNHRFTKAMRYAFQEGFKHVYSQLKGEKYSEHAYRYISNCLTFLPYSDPTPYESFLIPQWVNGAWELVDYKVEPIELTPTSGFKALFIRDEDRVFAYGLMPISNKGAHPHVIFMGTTYPAGQGFVTQVNTDLESFETVGKKLYRTGRENILRWISLQDTTPYVCGTSLGGSLSLLLAIDKGNRVYRVNALNPAGLYPPLRKSRYDHWDELDKKPNVIIQKQIGDPVSKNGMWKKDWTVYEVIPPVEKRGPNIIADHAMSHAGYEGTQFNLVNTVEDNRDRAARTFWIYTLLRSLIYYTGMLPFRYFVLPIVRYILRNKIQTLFFLGIFISYLLLLGLPGIGTAALACGIIASTAYCFASYLLFLKDRFTNRRESDFSKAINWFFDQSLVVQFLVSIALMVVFPVLITSFIMGFPIYAGIAVVGISSSIKIGYELFNVLSILLGAKDISPPACQDKTLPRNKDMDIYRKKVEETFTVQEIQNYFYVKRQVLKKDALISLRPSKSKIEFKGTSKVDILKQKNDISEKITVTASKAKIIDMKKTVKLIAKFGLNKERLQAVHDEYKQGKAKAF